jgi:hypothetical protein
LTTGPIVYKWYFAVPTIPLADAVATFNARHKDDPVGQFEPPITEAEVITSIRTQLPNLLASKTVKSIYSDILRTSRIPHDASFHAISGWELRDGNRYTVWWINLDVRTGKDSGYGLRIRENNAPVAKPKDEPKLERRDLLSMPEAIQ